jgi:hypothetical protein
MRVPLHSDYDSLRSSGYARANLVRARSVVNIQSTLAPAALRCCCQAAISRTRCSRSRCGGKGKAAARALREPRRLRAAMALGCHVETQSPRRGRIDSEGTAQPFDGGLAAWPELWAAHTSGHLPNAEVYRVSDSSALGRNTFMAVTSTARTKRGRSPNVSRAEAMAPDGPAAVSSIARPPTATPHPAPARSRSAAGPFAPRQTLSLARANARRR